MRESSGLNIFKSLILLLILSVLTGSLYSQDKKISGIINLYKHVTAIGPGVDNVTLDDVTGLNPLGGDTILLIQIKGALIDIPETGSYGFLHDTIGSPGRYEFLIVQSVNTGTKVVVFENPILNNYNVTSSLQLIKVPYYNSATVISTLTCQPWDSISKTGGVLTMIVGRTLSLNANIDVTGKGFYGGVISIGQGECTFTDPLLYDRYFYPDILPTNSGLKGESQVTRIFLGATDKPSIYPNYARGKGPNLTGGGGGNGKFAGGAGGSNYGSGGGGGVESNTCSPNQGGSGFQNKTVVTTDLNGGLFFGGGGGSSTYKAGSIASAGGRGGGIIIILCDTLKGNGNLIRSDGQWPSITTSGVNAGAGGGGGGGSVALYQQSFSSLTPIASSALTISAKGGNGGNTLNWFGEGGGGGGGLILTNNLAFPTNVTKNVGFGTVGTRTGGSLSGSNGTEGVKLTTFTPVLNGFLFNSIRSSVTGNQIDSICSNVPFGTISGTVPVGGVAPYTYLWESSTVSETGPWSAAAGTNNQNDYSPGLLAQTTWFRRTVTDNGAPILTDISKSVQIIVQQAITGNLVGKDTIICYNQNPLPLIPLNAGPSNGSSYNYYLYRWIQNTTNTNWTTSPDATGTFNLASYDPPALSSIGPNYFQRVVTSGRCISYSSTVTITVLPVITGNVTARPDSVICEGSLFNNLSASAPGGGDFSYIYQWQDSITSSFWQPAAGVNTGAVYTPDTSTFSVVENRYLRRVVFSGADDVCQNSSVPILLTRYHKIENNSIAADQTICSGTSPVPFTGSVPTQGKTGDYTYIWQDSIRTGIWTTRAITDFSHAPGNLTDTTWYRRIVNSSKCTNKSLPIRVNVHKPIAANTISLLAGGLTDSTICYGQVPHSLKGSVPTGGTDIAGSYIYQWKYSTDNITYNSVATSGNTINYQPVALNGTTYYKRDVISGTCSGLSNAVTITVLPLITNNTISTSQTICYNTTPAQLTGTAPAGGAGAGTYTYYWEQSSDGGTVWTAATGANTDASGSYSPVALTIPMKYRRTVTSGLSGCCTNISNIVTISQYPPLPTGRITNISDTTICGGSDVLLKLELSGVGPWKVNYKENSVDSPVLSASVVKTTLTVVNPASPSALNTYTYSLARVEDSNGCLATSLSGTKKADVYKVPTPVAGDPQTVCGPVADLRATPSAGTGVWVYPPSVVASTANNPNVTVTIAETYAGGNTTEIFSWEEINWTCKGKSSVSVTFEKSIASINAGRDTLLYSFDNVFHLGASPVQTWEVGTWSAGTGIEFSNSNDPKSIVKNLVGGSNIITWTIVNGQKCRKTDDVIVTVNDLVIPRGFSPNNDGVNDIFIIRGFDLPNQDAELKIVNGAGSEVFSTSKSQGWSDWDGKTTDGFDLPEGTYYYLLKLTSLDNGKIDKRSGYIILKRY